MVGRTERNCEKQVYLLMEIDHSVVIVKQSNADQ